MSAGFRATTPGEQRPCMMLPIDTADRMWGPAQDPDPTIQKGLTQGAMALCARCPLQTACLADTIAAGDQHGVRGGLRVRDRRLLADWARADHTDPADPAAMRDWLDTNPDMPAMARRVRAHQRRNERRKPAAANPTLAMTSTSRHAGVTHTILHTGHALHTLGHTTRIIDMSTNQTLLDWADTHPHATPVPILPSRAIRDHHPGITLVDAGNQTPNPQAVTASDLVILAANPTNQADTVNARYTTGQDNTVLPICPPDQEPALRDWLTGHHIGQTATSLPAPAKLPDGTPRPDSRHMALAREILDTYPPKEPHGH